MCLSKSHLTALLWFRIIFHFHFCRPSVYVCVAQASISICEKCRNSSWVFCQNQLDNSSSEFNYLHLISSSWFYPPILLFIYTCASFTYVIRTSFLDISNNNSNLIFIYYYLTKYSNYMLNLYLYNWPGFARISIEKCDINIFPLTRNVIWMKNK